MRGGRRYEDVGARGRGHRDLSPDAARYKDRRRPDWHHRSDLQRGRSVSPSMSRPLRSPALRNSSIERREYAPRQSDYARRGLYEDAPRYEDAPSPGHRRRHSPFNDERYELAPNYMLPDHPSGLNLPQTNPILRPSRGIKGRDYLPRGNGGLVSSSSGLEPQNMLLQRSVYSDGGPSRGFYSLQEKTSYHMDAAAMRSEDIEGDNSTLKGGVHDYPSHLRDSYDVRDVRNEYPKDAAFASVMRASHLRSLDEIPSLSMAKDDMLGLNTDHRLLQPPASDTFLRDSFNKFSEEQLGGAHYSQLRPSDSIRRGPLSPQVLRKHSEYGYHELSQKDRDNPGFLEMDDVHRKMPWSSSDDYRDKLNASFSDLARERINVLNAPRKRANESILRDRQQILHEDVALDYQDVKRLHNDYVSSSSTSHLGFQLKSNGREFPPLEDSYILERDASLLGYREPRSPMLSDRHIDLYRQDRSPPPGRYDMEYCYDQSPDRVMRRKYGENHPNENERRRISLNDRRRVDSSIVNNDTHHKNERRASSNSKRMGLRHLTHGFASHRQSNPDSGDFSNREIGRHNMSLKRRLRPDPSEFHNSYLPERKKSFKLNKFEKRSVGDKPHARNSYDVSAPDDEPASQKRDPPTDSDEFTQQVHKSFLRFCKMLNEPLTKKKYQQQGVGKSLRCCACGSRSKEFTDTHSIVEHAYHTKKVGLKTEHLGWHKALCVLMGWNWQVAPDTSKVYQSTPVTDAKTLKDDLILWPPVVIIHNITVTSKASSSEKKLLSIEGMEELLKDSGFGTENVHICRGKPANGSIFLVKFPATLSGLHEAESLQKYFVDRSHGREEFQQMAANKGKTGGGGGSKTENVVDFLYGYMSVAEDLHKLDSETMKRCLVKSKKDIAAIADAPLNVD